MGKTNLLLIFLCIFQTFLCISKNGWPEFVIAPIALTFFWVLNYVLKQLRKIIKFQLKNFGFIGHPPLFVDLL